MAPGGLDPFREMSGPERARSYRLLRWAAVADVALGTLALLFGDDLWGRIELFGPVTVTGLVAAVLILPSAAVGIVLSVLIRGAEDEEPPG